MRIYLVGYMGSGKSTIGRDLARTLGISWLDLDDEFESRYKIAIPDFFSKYGENAFRDLENKILKDISEIPEIVVSTGGGLPCFHDNMQLMNQTGLTIYLEVNPQILISRIELSARKRPLFQQMKGENIHQEIAEHLGNRVQFYKQARIVFPAEKADIQVLKTSITAYYNNINA